MSTVITYSNQVVTQNTVKPTATPFGNDTDKPIALTFNAAPSVVVPVGETSAAINTAIISINYGALSYYSIDNSFTIPPNSAATITKSGLQLIMTID